jgi:hypothetical protein|nr:hypothetical protein [Kofleriaceae bacterium]
MTRRLVVALALALAATSCTRFIDLAPPFDSGLPDGGVLPDAQSFVPDGSIGFDGGPFADAGFTTADASLVDAP